MNDGAAARQSAPPEAVVKVVKDDCRSRTSARRRLEWPVAYLALSAQLGHGHALLTSAAQGPGS